jgi:hypothetical protein
MTVSVPIGNEAARFYVTGPKELTSTKRALAASLAVRQA